jgi:hypothetical protein
VIETFEELLARAKSPELTDAMIQRVVRTAEKAAPRSLQTTIGLSEIGAECDRQLAYKLAGVEGCNSGRDNWLATVGTAVHSWLADAFVAENERLGRERFLVERRVWLTGELTGTCDLFDTDTSSVVDHKILGVTSLQAIRNGVIPPKYRVQLHSYGLGWVHAGQQVRRVVLACYPRSDNLQGDFSGKGLYAFTEPYEQRIAELAVERVEQLRLTVEAGVSWERIDATPGDDCRYCPFFNPGGGPADETGCPGASVVVPASMPGIV